MWIKRKGRPEAPETYCERAGLLEVVAQCRVDNARCVLRGGVSAAIEARGAGHRAEHVAVIVERRVVVVEEIVCGADGEIEVLLNRGGSLQIQREPAERVVRGNRRGQRHR